MPVFHRENVKYGGNTACVRLDVGGRMIVIDGGSGLTGLQADLQAAINAGEALTFDILLSHLHLDHIIGFSSFDPLFNAANDMRIFTKSRDARPLGDQVFGVFKPPYWPVDYAALSKAAPVEIMPGEPFLIDSHITVTPFLVPHADDTTGFRIESAGKTVVYLMDCEIDETISPSDDIVRYAKGADVIIFDCAFFPEDYIKGWGHSTYQVAQRLLALTGCGKIIMAHIGQAYSDEMMDGLKGRIADDRLIVAYEGLEIEL